MAKEENTKYDNLNKWLLINHSIIKEKCTFDHFMINCFDWNKKEDNIKNIDIKDINREESNILLGSYLAGLFEGDGHIWIPKDTFKKKHNPRFCITFHEKNLPLAKVILCVIGSGFIRIKNKENAVVLTISSIKGHMVILNLIGKYLRTPKIYQVNNLINWLNLHKNINFSLKMKNEKPINTDYWLSGFIDADGGFLINYIENKKNQKVNIKFTLTIEQRMKDPKSGESYESILKIIANYLNVKLNIRKQKLTGNYYYRIVGSSIISRSIINNYLEKYPLLSSKYLDYIDWKEGSLIYTQNKPLTNINIIKIKKLKMSMKNKRTSYNWDHLYKSKIFVFK